MSSDPPAALGRGAVALSSAAVLGLGSLGAYLYRRSTVQEDTAAAPGPAPPPTTTRGALSGKATLTVDLSRAARADSLLASDPVASPDAVLLQDSAALPAELVELWREGVLCDVQIHAGAPGEEPSTHAAHRLVLAAQSELLREAFRAALPPSHIRLSHLSRAACEAILVFAYEGRCEVTSSALLVQLLHAAAQLQLLALRDAAAAAIASLLAPDSCLGAWTLAQARAPRPSPPQPHAAVDEPLARAAPCVSCRSIGWARSRTRRATKRSAPFRRSSSAARSPRCRARGCSRCSPRTGSACAARRRWGLSPPPRSSATAAATTTAALAPPPQLRSSRRWRGGTPRSSRRRAPRRWSSCWGSCASR